MNLTIGVYIFSGIYFSAVAIEAIFSYYLDKGFYDVRDTVVNFTMGVIAIILRLLTKGLWLALWIFLYQFAPFRIAESVWSWILLFLVNEFIYYWFHRLSHENRLLWAIHVNHHSSEKMNFSTAARVPFLNIVLHNIFWIPLLFAGFNPIMIFYVETVSFLFTFFQHTQMIRRLPYFDLIFNSPSHHRVHHSSNPEYLNKNYGSVLIIFDRLFGTFKDEDQHIQAKFGLAKNILTYNLMKVIFHEWMEIISYKRGIKRLIQIVRIKRSNLKRNFIGWVFRAWVGVCLLSAQPGKTQSLEALWQDGVCLEKRNEDARALPYFTKILQYNPRHIGALCKASMLHSRFGGRPGIRSERKENVLKAKTFAFEAIQIDTVNIDAHFLYIVALGLLSEMADNPKDKLENARIIKKEAEIVLRLDPNHAAVYYVLGKWNDALSQLNWIEQFLSRILLGGIPAGASYPEALRNFQHAIDLRPDCILFYYGMAKTLAGHGQRAEALKKLEEALSLPLLEPDDQLRRENCKRLVGQIENKKL